MTSEEKPELHQVKVKNKYVTRFQGKLRDIPRLDIPGIEGAKYFLTQIQRAVHTIFLGNEFGKERRIRNRFVKDVRSKADAREITEKYSWLKQRGFPVVDSMIQGKDGKLYMSDATERGKYTLYDKHRPFYTHAHHSLEELIINKEEVLGEAYNVSLQAYQQGFTLSSDAFAILVDSNKIGRIVLLDIGWNSFIGLSKRFVSPEHDAKKDIDYFQSQVFD